MLTKQADRVFVPGTPGQPALPQRQVCTSTPAPPAGGSWQTVCTTTQLFVGWDNGPATFDNPGPFPKPVYINTGVVCRTQWVPAPVKPQPPPPQQCETLPAQPFIPATPARIDTVPVFAWNSGANSEQQQDGNCRVEFTMPQAVGAIVGFTQDRDSVESPDRMTHAFAFTTAQSGAALVQVREGARVLTSARTYTPEATLFEIRRAGGAVTYWVDGEIVYRSRVQSEGTVSVGCALYATGDRAP